MALLAKTIKTIEIKGSTIPIPFSETMVSPDIFRDQYTNIPNKKKFNMMLSRPNTTCNCLFLKEKIEIKDSKAEAKNKQKIKVLSIA